MTSSTAQFLPPSEGEMVPRFRLAGEVALDIIYRDGRVGDQWLGLHPREFELLWRLAKEPGVVVTRQQLLAEVWRIHHEPQTNSVAVHVARVRGKLAQFDLAHLVATHSQGGYFLDTPPVLASIHS